MVRTKVIVGALAISSLFAFHNGFAIDINPEKLERDLANIRSGDKVVEKPSDVRQLEVKPENDITSFFQAQQRVNPYLKVMHSEFYKQMQEKSRSQTPTVLASKKENQRNLPTNQAAQPPTSNPSSGEEDRWSSVIAYDYGYCVTLNEVIITPANPEVGSTLNCTFKQLKRATIEGIFAPEGRSGALKFTPKYIILQNRKVPISGQAFNRNRSSQNVATYINNAIVAKIVAKSAYDSGSMVLEVVGERFKNAGKTTISPNGTTVTTTTEPSINEVLRAAGVSFFTALYKEMGAMGLRNLDMNTPIYKVDKGTVLYLEITKEGGR